MEDNVQEMYQKARKAFEEVEFWPQEKVDDMVLAVGWEWQRDETAGSLARLAVEESGIGVYEDKMAKIKTKTLGSLWDMRGVRTCGVVGQDKSKGLTVLAKPMGVIANVVPCTNPESTICALGLSILKTRNAMIVSPHPRTPGSSDLTVEHGRKALRGIGAPEDLMQCIKNPSRGKATELMKACDFVVATGGAALIEAVYAAGKPCHTVGAGNVISIVDETVDMRSTASKIVRSKTANNSASCSSENAVAIHNDAYVEMMEALQEEGGHLCTMEERESLRRMMWPDGSHLNREVVGRSALHIAEMAGIDVPKSTRFIMVLGDRPGPEDRFSGEKLCPVLTVWRWSRFDEIVERTAEMLRFSGEGHSVSIHSNNVDRQVELAMKTKVGRVICNMPHAMANSGSWFSGLPFTDSLGCGTWAGNMTTDNINYRHFLNYTWLSVPIEECVPSREEIFGARLSKLGGEQGPGTG